MKLARLLPILALTLFGQRINAQTPTLINLLAHLVKCPGTTPAVLMWTGATVACVPLGPGLAVTGGLLTASGTTAVPSAWRVESISLATTPIAATQITYTPAVTPVSGIVLYWYASTNLLNSNISGAVAWTAAPLTITLPTGWQPSDSITIAYQSQ